MKYTTIFSSTVKPLITEEKDKYLAMASLVDVGEFIPEIDTDRNIDLLPIAFNVINKAVDKLPEDLDELLKKFVVSLLKKAAAKTGNKVDDLLVQQLEKALFDS